MMDIRVANAPCSWGALEFEGMEGGIAYPQMLDELRDTGYVGTELGDWGYMPADPVALKEELESRKLAMVGAFVPVALKYSEAHAGSEADAMKVARLLAAVANSGASGQLPLVNLADANGTDPLRTQYAGRVTSDMGLIPSEWKTFAGGAERIGQLHAEHLSSRIPSANLVMVADTFEETARECAERYSIPYFVQDYHAILDHPNIQAVVICSSIDTHAQIIEEEAQAGKHIFCEKPIALDLPSIDRALDSVERCGVKLQIGFNRRFDAIYRRVR